MAESSRPLSLSRLIKKDNGNRLSAHGHRLGKKAIEENCDANDLDDVDPLRISNRFRR
jgi:hypothetical protein